MDSFLDTRLLVAKKIRDLCVQDDSRPGRPPFLSAASGLVRIGELLYVVADDELHLGVFRLGSDEPGTLARLLPGKLPADPKSRKKEKPDHEALVLLDSRSLSDGRMLLAVPSGSKAHRSKGVLAGLDSQGALTGERREADFALLFEKLRENLPELNIEGAVVTGDWLKLFQRGNGARGENAVIDLELVLVLDRLRNGAPLDASLIRSISRPQLGKLHGVSLSFTDATVLEDGCILFLAAAESGDDTYEDGACAGSTVGCLNADGMLEFLRELSPRVKAEGVTATLTGDGIQLYFVNDEDDPNQPAGLYSCRIRL